jgi:hypothetical protein
MRIAIALSLMIATAASAADVTIDMNGFPDLTGGHVNGPGLTEPVKFTSDDTKVEVKGLQAGQTYSVDFYHNSGESSSDFTFRINDAGTGVESVSLAGEKYSIVKDFKKGDATLTLDTVDIVYNANAAQTGNYGVSGLIAATGMSSMPQKLKAVPGWYAVDNLYNTGGGNEDYQFVVDSNGKTGPAGDRDAEYAEFDGNQVKPRAAVVHFKIEASGGVNYHASHVPTAAAINGTVYEFDVPLTIGSGGINLWSFGDYTVTKSNVMAPETRNEDGTVERHKLEGVKGTNDLHFYPRLRYDLAKKAYYFETTDAEGRSTTATAEATGTYDGGDKPLTITITATIVKPTETQPAGK